MNAFLRISLILVIVMSLSIAQPAVVQSAASGVASSPPVGIPWKSQIVHDNQTAEKISVAFAGSHNYPLISYDTDLGVDMAMPAVGGAGDCGSGYAWNCLPLSNDNLHTSHIQVFNASDRFTVGWIYKKDGVHDLYLGLATYSNDLVGLGGTRTKFVDPDAFSSGPDQWQIGPMDFVFDVVGNPHAVFQIGYSYYQKVIYAHKVAPSQLTHPCNLDNGTLFQCDIIYADDNVATGLGTELRIVLTGSGEPRISFFDFDQQSWMYAYPQSNLLLHPNCGPGNNTWRCIVIDRASADYYFYNEGETSVPLDMAIGPASPHLIIRSHDADRHWQIRYARYVSSGGNCGQDYRAIPIPPYQELINRWECTTIPWIESTSPQYANFSLQVDDQDFPLIALNYLSQNYQVGLLYPAEMTGGAAGSWLFRKVDGRDIDTGYAVDFVLGKNDLGLMGYSELEDYSPNLKIALQRTPPVYIPLVRK